MGIEFGKNARTDRFGRRVRKDITRGSFYAQFTYVPKRDEHDRPLMDDREIGVIIMRASDVPHANAGRPAPKVIIGLTEVWKYGVDSYMAKRGWDYARFLGFGESKFAAHTCMDFLQDMIIELLTMKPEHHSELDNLAQEAIESVRVDSNRVDVVLH